MKKILVYLLLTVVISFAQEVSDTIPQEEIEKDTIQSIDTTTTDSASVLVEEETEIYDMTAAPVEETLPDTAGKFGILFTANTDSVEILLDSTVLGTTPFVAEGLSDTTLSFIARKSGFYQKKITADFRTDTLITLNVELRQPATLTIITTPASASVLLNRKKVGNSPFTASQIKPDEYGIMLLKEGFELFDSTVTVESGANDTLFVNLVSENKDTTQVVAAVSADSTTSSTDTTTAATEESAKKKKKIDRIGIIVFLTIMVGLIGVQEYKNR